jgi:hypothetical protein
MASFLNPIFTDIFDSNLFDNNTTNGTNLNDNIVLDKGNDTSQGNLQKKKRNKMKQKEAKTKAMKRKAE